MDFIKLWPAQVLDTGNSSLGLHSTELHIQNWKSNFILFSKNTIE